MRSATINAACGSLRSSRSTANSSPPRRARVSPGAQAAFEASRKSDEQLIANQVSETVVNQFETIEIEEQHGERW